MRSHAHASAHAQQTYLRVLFVARMKSHIQLKGLNCSIGYSSFNPSFLFTSASLNNAVYVNSVSQALVTTARMPQFYRAFLCRFSVSFFFRTTQAYTVYYFKC